MEADCRQQLALAKVCTGEPSAAIEEARTALAICREIGNVHMMARVAMALGYGLVDAGLYDEAIQTLERALAEIRAVADAPLLVWALEGLGLAQLAARQFDTARPTLEEELRVSQDIAWQISIHHAARLCRLSALTGNWRDAQAFALQAMETRGNTGPVLTDLTYNYLPDAFLRAGDAARAVQDVRRLGENMCAMRRFHITYLRGQAALAQWEGKTDDAIRFLAEAAALAADLSLPGEQWAIEALLGEVYLSSGDKAQARTAFDHASTIVQALAARMHDRTLRDALLTEDFMLHMAGPMKAHVSRTGETVEGAILRIEQPRPDDKDRAAGHDVG
jgi:tetratricopeptide (TPR) repeat protein